MIHYKPGKWNISFALSLKGSVFPKAIVWALPCSVIAAVLHSVIDRHPESFSHLGAGDVGASVLSGFTFVLGFLVVFRSQQAFSRWWEGGTLLQQLRGEWFNAYSSLLAFCNRSDSMALEVEEFQNRLVRLMSLLYYNAMQQISTKQERKFVLLDAEAFDSESLKYMMNSHDGCEVCLQWIQRLITDASDANVLTAAPPILSRVYNQLGNGIVNLSNARKIRDFPIPFPVAQMITLMLLVHWMITAFVCAASVERPAWAALLSFIVTLSFWSIHYIAIELEQPFGDDANDLPLHEMQEDMHESLVALLDRCAQIPPHFMFSTGKLHAVRAKPNDVIRSSTPHTARCCLKPRPDLPADRPLMLPVAVAPPSMEIDTGLEADVGRDRSVPPCVAKAQPGYREGKQTPLEVPQDSRWQASLESPISTRSASLESPRSRRQGPANEDRCSSRSIERSQDPRTKQRPPRREQPEERVVAEGNGCMQVLQNPQTADGSRRPSKPMVEDATNRPPELPHQVDSPATRWLLPLPSGDS